jgi:hypothetical protein
MILIVPTESSHLDETHLIRVACNPDVPVTPTAHSSRALHPPRAMDPTVPAAPTPASF